MPKGTDYMPGKDAELLAWSKNFARIITEKRNLWNISDEEAEELEMLTATFADRYQKVHSPIVNKVLVEEKNEARQALKTRIRALTGYQLRNPAVTDADRVLLGLRLRDKNPTPIPVPVSRPEFYVEIVDIRELSIVFRDQGSAGKARPYGIIGAVIAWSVQEVAPDSPDSLARISLATRSPHRMWFDEEERGKTVHIALCWQNKKGQRGHWSEIQHALVP